MIIHCIGIGGIAVSGIANIYKQKGHKVQGSDAEESEITQELKKQGIKVFIGHSEKNIAKDIDLVIFSEAVKADNSELKEAKKLGIKCLSGAQALGELSRDHFTIAVSGMHGKSTTSSMVAQILVRAGFDPTFVIGTKPGYRLGKSKYLVIEADDYKAKFLNYKPNILILTNIEEEHLDYFQNLNHIFKVFMQYVNQVQNFVVANKDNVNVVKVLKKLKTQNSKLKTTSQNLNLKNRKVKFYSLRDKEAKQLKKILQVPGKHNVSNALAALKAARLLGIDDKISLKALSEYKGVWRRFEEREAEINGKNIKIISDYAHHPTEIKATLQAAQEKFPQKNIVVVFQPHQYQRTFYLFDYFVRVLRQAHGKFSVSKLIITDIYDVPGRENQEIRKKVSAQKLIDVINRSWAFYLPKDKLINYLKKNLKAGEVVVVMGAGDIYKLVEELK